MLLLHLVTSSNETEIQLSFLRYNMYSSTHHLQNYFQCFFVLSQLDPEHLKQIFIFQACKELFLIVCYL